MEIREFKTEDLEQLVTLAQQHNLLLPSSGFVNIAEGSNGIIGMMQVRLVATIEPFICTNPIAAKKLFETTMEQLKTMLKDETIIRCFAKPQHVDLYKKLGFYKVFNNHIIMEKGLHNDIQA